MKDFLARTFVDKSQKFLFLLLLGLGLFQPPAVGQSSRPETATIRTQDPVSLQSEELKQFLSQLLESSDHDAETEVGRKAMVGDLRKTFASHPRLLLQLVHEKGSPQLFSRAGIPLPAEKIQNTVEGMVPALKTFYDLEPQDIRPVVALSREKLGEFISSFPLDKRIEILKGIPDEVFLKTGQAINESIDQLKLSETDAIKMLNNPETGIDLSSLPKKMADFLEILLKQYFDKLPRQDKRGLVLAMVKLPEGATDVQKLGAFLQRSGPAVQKFFQLFGKSVKSEKIAAVMAELKSNILPFPGELAKKTIEENYGKDIGEIFSEFREKPIAAASVGQVHLAKLKGSNKEVVVKILRPGIQEKAERELTLMESIAPDEGTKQVVRRLKEALMEELDFRLEAQNIKEGDIYNRPRMGIAPIGEIAELPATRQVLVMEKAPGKTIDKFHTKTELRKKLAALENLLAVWLNESLLQGGFFHADLHSGNMFFEPKNNRVGYNLTMIDFGSTGHLVHKEKKALINLGLGMVFASPQTIVESFTFFEEISPEVQEKFLGKIQVITKNKIMTIGQKVNEILTAAMDLGINFPKNIIQFNRGKLFLDNQINETVKELMKMNPDRKFIKKYGDGSAADWVAARVLIKGLKGDVFKNIFHVGRSKNLLDRKTMRRIIREGLGPLIKEAIKKIRHPSPSCYPELDHEKKEIEEAAKEIEKEIQKVEEEMVKEEGVHHSDGPLLETALSY